MFKREKVRECEKEGQSLKRFFINPHSHPNGFYWGSQMFMDPHLSQQHEGPQDAVLQPQQEVPRPKARFKPTLPKKSGVDGRAIRCQHILVSCFNYTLRGDLAPHSFLKNRPILASFLLSSFLHETNQI